MSKADQSPNVEPSFRSVLHSMKKTNPPGPATLGSDGVMRTFGQYPDFPTIDAVGLSLSQIKQFLDLQEWSQEAQDKFRGVDGRKVTDQKALFEPRECDRIPRTKFTEEEKKIERERLAGVNVEEKYACGKSKSDHDLRPKGEL